MSTVSGMRFGRGRNGSIILLRECHRLTYDCGSSGLDDAIADDEAFVET
jgi:hypothetical protein